MSITSTKNGSKYVIAGIGSHLLVYDWKRNNLILREKIETLTPIYALIFHPNEDELWAGSTGYALRFRFQKRNWYAPDTLTNKQENVHSLAFTSSGSNLICNQGATTAYTSYPTPTLPYSPKPILQHSGRVLWQIYQQKKNKLAIATANGVLKIYQIKAD